MKYTKYIISVGIAALALGSAITVQAATKTPSGWVTYVDHVLGFQVAAPPNMIIVNDGPNGIEVTRSEQKQTSFSVGVFPDKTSLEQGMLESGSSSFDDSMKKDGLKAAAVTVDGKKVTAYYGKHIADAVGGKPYLNIVVEVVGSKNAYLLEFYNTSNIKNATVKKYLSSFHAE